MADEPTSNLDPKNAERILEVISALNERGMTVVLVEHRLDLVAKEASRMIIMDSGRIVADGLPRDVLQMDICEEIGVGIPKATQVYKQLRNRGITLGTVPLTGDELAAFVEEGLL